MLSLQIRCIFHTYSTPWFRRATFQALRKPQCAEWPLWPLSSLDELSILCKGGEATLVCRTLRRELGGLTASQKHFQPVFSPILERPGVTDFWAFLGPVVPNEWRIPLPTTVRLGFHFFELATSVSTHLLAFHLAFLPVVSSTLCSDASVLWSKVHCYF